MLAGMRTGAVGDQGEPADLLLMVHEVSFSIQDIGRDAGPDISSRYVGQLRFLQAMSQYILKRMKGPGL